jgi:hypothetical protein
MAQEGSISDIRFQLNETRYFFEQMKKNIDNSAYFIYNLVAFLSAEPRTPCNGSYEYYRRVSYYCAYVSRNVSACCIL